MKAFILSILLLAAAAIVYVLLNSRHDGELRDANRRIGELQTANNELSNSFLLARSRNEISQEQLLELMRLRARASVTKKAEEQVKAGATNTNDSAQRTNPPQVVAKEDWIYKGFSTPTDAVESVAWSLKAKDLDTFFFGLTPSSQEFFVREMQGKSKEEVEQLLGHLSDSMAGLRLDRQRTLENGDVQFTMKSKEEEAGEQKHRQEDIMRFENSNGEWRLKME